eukprot:gene15157-4525_t
MASDQKLTTREIRVQNFKLSHFTTIADPRADLAAPKLVKIDFSDCKPTNFDVYQPTDEDLMKAICLHISTKTTNLRSMFNEIVMLPLGQLRDSDRLNAKRKISLQQFSTMIN